MGSAEVLPRKPYFRVPVRIPTQWCTDCQITLRNETEYMAHTDMFPTHLVKPVTSLPCPKCGNEVSLENGAYAEHWVGYSRTHRQLCSGSGTLA